MPLLLAEIVSVVVCLSMTSLVYSSVTSLLLLLGVLGTRNFAQELRRPPREIQRAAGQQISLTLPSHYC